MSLIELTQPVSVRTIYSCYLAQRKPGLHHLAFSTTDLAAARKQLATGYPCALEGTIRGLVDSSNDAVRGIPCVVTPLQSQVTFRIKIPNRTER